MVAAPGHAPSGRQTSLPGTGGGRAEGADAVGQASDGRPGRVTCSTPRGPSPICGIGAFARFAARRRWAGTWPIGHVAGARHLRAGHREPRDSAGFPRQWVDANDLSAALLLPERDAVECLRVAKAERARSSDPDGLSDALPSAGCGGFRSGVIPVGQDKPPRGVLTDLSVSLGPGPATDGGKRTTSTPDSDAHSNKMLRS